MESQLGAGLQFFIYDTVKIFVLLSVLIFGISYIQSYFPPERTKKILGRFHGLGANTLSALLGLSLIHICADMNDRDASALNLFNHRCTATSTGEMCIRDSPEIGLYELIGLNLFFMILNFICGYYCFLRPVKCEKRVKKAAAGESVKSFFLNLSPIYVSILLNIVTGIPLYLCILVGIGITYLICDKKDFLKNFKDSINFNVVFTVAGVLVLQSCISSLDGLMEIKMCIRDRSSCSPLSLVLKTRGHTSTHLLPYTAGALLTF